MQINILIRNVRLNKKMTLRDLHKKTDISISHLSDIERGIKEPSFFNMVRIAIALDVSLYDLFKINY